MPRLVDRFGAQSAINLAKELTLTVLQRSGSTGTGDRWGADAADAFIACYQKIAELEIQEKSEE